MRLALEMSRQAQEDHLSAAQEEEEMIRLAIEASQQEEERRQTLVRQEEDAIKESQIQSAAPAQNQPVAA